jgi:ribosomal protein S18 acetylase RimI-like enzyme
MKLKNEMILKIASSADRHCVTELFLQIVSETATVNPAFMNWTTDSVDKAFDQYEFLVATDLDHKMVALICYQQLPDLIEILALGALKSYQRQGILQALLGGLVSRCSATSKTLSLEVHSQNSAAVALYSKCGFKTVRVRKAYYADAKDALVMDLQLKNYEKS